MLVKILFDRPIQVLMYALRAPLGFKAYRLYRLITTLAAQSGVNLAALGLQRQGFFFFSRE